MTTTDEKVEIVSIQESAREIIPMLRKVCQGNEENFRELVFEIYKQVFFSVNPTTKKGSLEI